MTRLMSPPLRVHVLSRRRLVAALMGVGAGAPLLSLAGCGASDPGYYTLSSWPGTAASGGPRTVEVRTPSVAPYLDRDTIVRNDKDYRLKLDGRAAWAAALPDMIGRNLALDLAQRLPGSSVYIQTGAISAEPLALVELDVSRFMENPSGQAEIEASLSVRRPDGGPSVSRTLRVVRDPGSTDIAALVGALSALLGRVADAAADALRALPPTGQSTAG